MTDAQLIEQYSNVLNRIEQLGIFPSRISNSISVATLGIMLIDSVCKRNGTSIEALTGITVDDMSRAIEVSQLEYNLDENGSNKSVIDITIETFDRMADQGRLVRGEDYRFDRNGYLLLDIKRIYDKYTKYRKEYSMDDETLPCNQYTKQLGTMEYFVSYGNKKFKKYSSDGIEVEQRKVYCLDYKKLIKNAEICSIIPEESINN
jgi:hypothetical protein